jgi:predicted nucleic acid-binding protein
VITVVDASVAALWVLDQQGSARAHALRSEGELIAPSLIASEIGSALWKAVRRRDVTRADALLAIEATLLPFERLVPDEELESRALAIAVDLGHPIYDCFYLALAERERSPLISVDKRLLAVAKKMRSVEVRTP